MAGEIRFTVPPKELPAKSPPLPLLAIMVLAMSRVPPFKMPPPLFVAELPERVELERVKALLL